MKPFKEVIANVFGHPFVHVLSPFVGQSAHHSVQNTGRSQQVRIVEPVAHQFDPAAAVFLHQTEPNRNSLVKSPQLKRIQIDKDNRY